MANCASCGAPLPPDARYCPRCAAPIRPAPLPSAAPTAPPYVPSRPLSSAAPAVYGAPPPPTPPVSIPFLPGETVERTYSMDVQGFQRVIRRNLLIMPLIMLIVFVPFLILLVAQGGGNPGALLGAGVLVVMIGGISGMVGWASRRASTRIPTMVVVTNRRVLVENFGTGESSASVPIDNIGDVTLEGGRVAKAAGVAWVYILPIGATQAMVGAGRARRAAPGVVWVPALPIPQAEEFRNYVLGRARALQAAAR